MLVSLFSSKQNGSVLLKCRLCCEVCAEKTRVNSYTILAVQRQTSRSKVVTWVKQQTGFTSRVLVSGGTWSKRGTGALVSIFSCELGVSVVLLVFLRDSLQSVLLGQCVAKPCLSRNSFGCPNVIQVRVFPAQKQEAKQDLTDAPFPPAVFFSEAKRLSNNGILALEAVSLSSNFFASFLQPICCSWYHEALPLWQTGGVVEEHISFFVILMLIAHRCVLTSFPVEISRWEIICCQMPFCLCLAFTMQFLLRYLVMWHFCV